MTDRKMVSAHVTGGGCPLLGELLTLQDVIASGNMLHLIPDVGRVPSTTTTTTATRALSCTGRRFLALSLTTVSPRISDQHVRSIATCRVSSVRMFSVAPTQISLTTSQPTNLQSGRPVLFNPISLTPVGCDSLVDRWGEETH